MALVVILVLGSGCAGLIIRPDDSAGSKVGKFTARFFLGAGTVLLSERIMIGVKSRDYERRVNLLLRDNIGIMSVDDAISYWGPPSSKYIGDEMYSVKWFGEGAITQRGYFKRNSWRSTTYRWRSTPTEAGGKSTSPLIRQQI